MQKIRPCLWFDNQLEDAMRFYTEIFPDARFGDVTRDGEGKARFATFSLAGQEFMGLNGGPHFTFNEAISFVRCEDQEEVDYYWEKLGDDGRPQQCGWLKDRFGVAWQIVPVALMRYLNDEDPQKAERVMQAMLQMVKLDVATLDRAYQG